METTTSLLFLLLLVDLVGMCSCRITKRSKDRTGLNSNNQWVPVPPIKFTAPPIEFTFPPIQITRPPIVITRPPIVITRPPIEITRPSIEITAPLAKAENPYNAPDESPLTPNRIRRDDNIAGQELLSRYRRYAAKVPSRARNSATKRHIAGVETVIASVLLVYCLNSFYLSL